MKTHEAFVHFPIALIISAFLFSIIGLLYRRGLFKEMIIWNLSIGIISTAAAIYSGMLEQSHVIDPFIREELDLHKRSAYTFGILLVILTTWMTWRKRTMGTVEYITWISLYFVASCTIVYQGYEGHKMTARMHQLQLEASKPSPAPKAMDYGWNF